MSDLNSSASKVRVLVVDDSAFVRRAIIRMFDNSKEISIIDVASDGQMAIELIKKLHPDVVTLDVQMPVLDGISALERIMKECPVPVVMLSSLTGRGGDQTLRALDLGAVDFIDKSSAGGVMDLSNLRNELTSKIMVAARIDLKKLASHIEKVRICPEKQPENALSNSEAVFIGISTGGPPALQSILSAIPAAFRVPIFIVQHMPVGFTASLAARLNRTCAISVKEAEDDEIALPGTAYVAPGGKHLKIKRSADDREIRMSLDQLPSDTLHRPSVDVLFQSAAEFVCDKALAFVLTGMGKDGVIGAKAIKEAGGRVFVESEATSVVFGMPKAVIEAVKVDGVVPLYSVADTILRMT
ncbi:MAG TPA: chemotaxis response regulator protein-glutamate methylesterase [Geobacteraceae bacterium]|nr:chemotaxis response regulator protein-glutamate methylesterase [Geobacteraceae bacterium]